MKTPTWESSPGALAAFLLSITGRGAASKGAIRDLYTITLRGGAVVRWTTNQSDLVLGARTFTARSVGSAVPLIIRKGSRCVAGLSEVGSLEVTLRCDAATTWGGRPLPLAVLDGLFDGAMLELERAFMAGPGQPVIGAVSVFAGYIEAQPTSTSVTLSVESIAARLGRISVPRAVVQDRCLNQLGDSACGVNLATWTFASSIGSGATTLLVPTGLAQADRYFYRAVVSFLSGAAAGERRMVMSHASGVLELAMPLPVAPAAGDQISIVKTCSRDHHECNDVFANIARFRGMPYVPTGTEMENL